MFSQSLNSFSHNGVIITLPSLVPVLQGVELESHDASHVVLKFASRDDKGFGIHHLIN